MRRSLVLIGLVAGFASPALAAGEATPPTHEQEMARSQQESEAQEALWRKRWQEHVAAEKQAEQRLAAAQEAHDELKNHRLRRGKSAADVQRELDDAEKGLARAKKDLQDFYDEAHREGIQPGWVGSQD